MPYIARSVGRHYRQTLIAYLLGVIAIAIAMGVRFLLDPILGDLYPFATVFLAVLVTAAYFGPGPAICAALIGSSAVSYFLLPPRGHFTVDDGTQSIGQLLNLLVSLGIAVLGGSLRAARHKAEVLAIGNQRQQARLQSILDNAGDGIVSKDLRGVVQSFNPAAERMFGYSAAEMIGTPILRLVPVDRHHEETHILECLARGESVNHFETIRLTRDGRHLDVDVSVSPIKDPGGAVIGVSKIVRDISLRKRMEARLHEREEQLRLYAEYSPAAIAMFDREMRYVVASGRWHEAYHLSPGSLVGRSHYDVFPEIPQRWKEVHQRCLAGAVEKSDEDAFPRADGTIDWIRWEVRPWTQMDGTIAGIIVFSEDVSERKRAEEALRKSEGRYRTLFEYAPDGILIADRNSYYLDANPAICRMLGYSHAELIGRHATDIVAPVETPQISPALSIINAASDYHREWRFRRRDGSLFAADMIATLMPDGHILAMIRDVTERNRAIDELRTTEERMRFALENAEVGIWDMDYAAGELRWSPILERQYGVLPGTFAGTVDAFLACVHPDDRRATVEAIDEAAKSGSDFSLQHRAVWADGTVRWLNGAGRIVLGTDGAPIRGVGISLDVTDRRILEAQYQQAQKMDAIGRLAGGVAHDFNNLLTAILGHCELLLADLSAQDPRAASVTEIQKAGATAASLTRQLLAFSRKQIIEPTVLDLNAIVLDLRSMLERLIGEDIRISLALAPSATTVLADRGQIEQIVLNLAVNARDAMSSGGTLTIETARLEIDSEYPKTHLQAIAGPYAMLVVSDTGMGMTPETQARLFEPFFTTKDVGKGTGLGLAIVHGVVKRSGGFINVYSEVGKGTSFSIYLPRVDAVVAAPAKPPTVVPASLGGSETILVVEDSDGLRELAQKLLERQGYRVLAASNGDEALALVEQHTVIDVLLTDVVMPGASGPELTKQIVQRRPGLKVIFMSGYTEDAIVSHGIVNPGVAFLHKPFSSDSLGRKIRQVLQS